MQLLIVRHAPAQDRDEFYQRTGGDDSQRPLTSEGKAKMRKAARGLMLLLPKLRLLVSSPFRRALETRNILREFYAEAEIMELAALEPGSPPDAIGHWLMQQESTYNSIALIGHEPDLSRLTGWLLCGQAESFIRLKKGAACLLRGVPAAGQAQLEWALMPGQLRKLAEMQKL
jgi:phosphohistidine phosphatase